jgi:short-subunit dehydrogenase
MTDLNEKIVLITGMTQQFRDAGCKLVLTDISEKALRSAVDDAGDAVLAAVAADLATEEGCGVIAGACTAGGIQPDVLVNNAGIGFGGRLDHVPREKWESLMQLNLLAPMRLCNLFLPQMIEKGCGHIVNISSLAGWVGSPGLSSYCASKFGLRGFGEAMAVDLEGTGVQVSNVYPCFSRTPILDSPQYGYEERRAVPENLISEPSDVVARIINGIRKDTLHIFPDKHSRRIHYMKRFAPWLITLVNRRMQNDSVKAAREAD